MRLILAAVAAIMCAFSAYAADFPTKATPAATFLPYSWSGLYLSGYGLYGWNITNTPVTAGNFAADVASAPNGPGLGGAIGYNWQANGLVFGVRADIAYANLTGGGGIAQSLRVSNATNYLGDFDVIVGLTLSPDGRLLGYGGGGFAYGGAKPNLAAFGTAASISDTSTGWNVLGGLAYQLTPNWSVFLETNYYQLGDKSLTLNVGGMPVATSLNKYDIIVQKAGVNFKF